MKARKWPLGDHLGSRLSPVLSVRFLATPVSIFNSQTSVPLPLLRSSSTTYASHLPSGENWNRPHCGKERICRVASTGNALVCGTDAIVQLVLPREISPTIKDKSRIIKHTIPLLLLLSRARR